MQDLGCLRLESADKAALPLLTTIILSASGAAVHLLEVSTSCSNWCKLPRCPLLTTVICCAVFNYQVWSCFARWSASLMPVLAFIGALLSCMR